MCPPAVLLTLIENAFSHNEYRDGAEFEVETTHSRQRHLRSCAVRQHKPSHQVRPHKTVQALPIFARDLKEAFGDDWSLKLRADPQVLGNDNQLAVSVIDMLIVEDEPLVAKRLERFAREALGNQAGKSAFARSIEEATPLAECLSASAVLFLDLNLFGADGFDLLGN